jgi:putative ABC transport system ATP-binding protein
MDSYRAIVRRAANASPEAIDAADRQALLRLAYGYIEPRHRHGLLDTEMEAAIVAARRVFHA